MRSHSTLVLADRFGLWRRTAVGLLAVLPLLVCGEARGVMTYLKNGTIQVGVDLARGGAITQLQLTRGLSWRRQNVVNSYDLGRGIQQSYYYVPMQYNPPGTQQNPNWSPWPWNPVQSGDSFGNASKVLASSNNGTEIYVKTRPLQWSLKNVSAQATMEQWIRLDGAGVRVHCRLTNMRGDDYSLLACEQEAPALFSAGNLSRLYTYTGLQPFTNAPLTRLPATQPPWQYWRATESWAALVDATGWGIGVRTPGIVQFKGGYYGTATTSRANGNSTGYIAPIARDVLDPDIVYEYDYDLTVGSLSDIRKWIYARPADPRPDYRFLTDRQHWYAANETSVPEGAYHVDLSSLDQVLCGPESAFRSESVPKLYVSAAYHLAPGSSSNPVARLLWQKDNATTYDPGQALDFSIIADGQYHTYELSLASLASYRGLISKLALDPLLVGGKAGDWMDLRFISYQNLTNSPDFAAMNVHTVPEPTVVTLLLAGAAALFGMRRWHRRRNPV